MKNLSITIEVPMQRICDVLCNAIESGYPRYWCQSVEYAKPEKLEGKPDGFFWYNEPESFDVPMGEVIFHATHEHATLGSLTTTPVNRHHFMDGIRRFAKDKPRHLVDILQEQDDNITADILLQYVVMGQEVYS